MIKQITSLTDLLALLPKLVKLYTTIDGLWDPDLDNGQFASRLLYIFNEEESAFFCEEAEEGFKYVAILHKQKNSRWYFWLFYVNTKNRDLTRPVLNELSVFCKKNNITSLRFSTTRTTRSYERWVAKFGAHKQAIVYQLDI